MSRLGTKINIERSEGVVLRCPEEPTEEEVQEHFALGHPNFRSWCPHCVKGGGQSQERRKVGENREDIVPKLCVDYMTMGERVAGQEEGWKKGHTEQDSGNPIVVYSLNP